MTELDLRGFYVQEGLYRLPPGEFTVSTPILVPGTARIIGEGPDHTRLKIGPENPTQPFVGLQVAAGEGMYLSGVRLSGPDNPGATLVDGSPSGLPIGTDSTAIVHDGGTGGWLDLDSVVIDGWFGNAIENRDQNADTRCSIALCDIQAWKVGITGTGHPSVAQRKQIIIRDSVLRGKGAAFPSNQCHLIYIGPSTSLLAENVRFVDSPGDGYCLHHYSSASEMGALFDAVLRNCHVEASCTNGYYLSDQGLSAIEGGTIRSTQRGMVPRGPLLARDVHMIDAGAAVRSAGSADVGTIYEFNGCRWDGCTVNLEATHDGTIWRVFGGAAAGGSFVSNSSSALVDFIATLLVDTTFSFGASGKNSFRNVTTKGTTTLPTADNITASGTLAA